MIREIMPDAKKIGILYTTSEANSVSAPLQEYKKLADKYDLEIVETGITHISRYCALQQQILFPRLTACTT